MSVVYGGNHATCYPTGSALAVQVGRALTLEDSLTAVAHRGNPQDRAADALTSLPLR
ncbi:hypothetical protein [Dendronalium sp. ChiSLP03b]|uniref:hypothetical protein n=1 Tax=Dendronalium sp. ChiSLP03b TaxID=3075381 RepID=UPI002ADB8364|nr:hypothetical protein [Dendronalium sp. ChiSLP03b]